MTIPELYRLVSLQVCDISPTLSPLVVEQVIRAYFAALAGLDAPEACALFAYGMETVRHSLPPKKSS